MTRRHWLLTLLALLLLAAWISLLLAIPRGPHEFGYSPLSHNPPFSPLRGFTAEQWAAHGLRLALGLPALALLSWGLSPLLSRLRLAELDPGKLALWTGVASVTATAVVMLGVLRGRALVDDSLTYAMQADLLSRGQLGFTDLEAMAPDIFVIATRVGFTGKYLFGEPLVQIPGVLVGIPALAHLPLAAATLWLLYQGIQRMQGREVAGWATALVAISPSFVLVGASALSHSTTLAAVAAAIFGLGLVTRGECGRGGHWMGAGVAFCGTVRPQVAVPVGAVLLLFGLVMARRHRGSLSFLLPVLLWNAMAGVTIGLYDKALTGSALTLPWFLHGMAEHYGFGRVWEHATYEHTPLAALWNLLVVTIRADAWWLGWPSSLAVLGLWWATGRPGERLGPWWGVLGAVLAFNFFYVTPGIGDFGPIYHLEALVALSVLAGAALPVALRRWPWVGPALVVHVLVGTLGFSAWQAWRLGRMAETIHAPAQAVLDQLERPALLLVDADCTHTWRAGWVFSAFPQRALDRSEPVVILLNPGSDYIDDHLAAYPDRRCYLTWREGPQARVAPCEEVMDRLRAEPAEVDPDQCGRAVQTAERLGWWAPDWRPVTWNEPED